jgi:hypothetical protein
MIERERERLVSLVSLVRRLVGFRGGKLGWWKERKE